MPAATLSLFCRAAACSPMGITETLVPPVKNIKCWEWHLAVLQQVELSPVVLPPYMGTSLCLGYFTSNPALCKCSWESKRWSKRPVMHVENL